MNTTNRAKHHDELQKKEKAVLTPPFLTLNDPELPKEIPEDRQEQILSARREYLEEMARDLHEISQEIIDKESFKEIISLLGTKYAIERNILAAERNILGEKRTLAAGKRTALAEQRSGMSRIRTALSRRRTFLAEKRSIMAQHRNLLAKARTELAFIRTGVAFAALATGLIRYFGIGWWTVMDVSILILGVSMIITGIYYYLPTREREVSILEILRQREEELLQRSPRIMIIDDDPAFCDLLRIYLKKKGYETEAYTTPYPARERLESTAFDIVITDYMMEGYDGEQIVNMIKRIAPETAIIMISCMSAEEEPLASMQKNLFAFFKKPVNLKELHDSIKTALKYQPLENKQ